MITLISTTTVGAGGAASIDFTSIPGTYTDLMLQVSVRGTTAAQADELLLTFNGSATGYSYRQLYGSGSVAGAGGNTSATFVAGIWQDLSTSTANTFGNGTLYIPSYAGNTYKGVSGDSVSETNAASAYGGIVAGIWANTAAITSISLKFGSGSIVQYSTATLYGITKGSGGATVSP